MAQESKSRNEASLTKLRQLLETEKFKNEIERLREYEGRKTFLLSGEVLFILRDYGLPITFSGVIHHLIKTGEINEHLISSPVEVVSHYHKTVEPSDEPEELYRAYASLGHGGITLSIAPDATKNEILMFVEKYYSTLIKPLQNDLGGLQRITYKDAKELKRKVLEADKKGLSATAISTEFDISIPRVYQILNKKKL